MTERNPTADPAASALAARRRVGSRACARCGKAFDGLSTARYCSPTCRTIAYRRRKAQLATADHA